MVVFTIFGWLLIVFLTVYLISYLVCLTYAFITWSKVTRKARKELKDIHTVLKDHEEAVRNFKMKGWR